MASAGIVAFVAAFAVCIFSPALTAVLPNNATVSEVCLGCICQAVSQCNLTIGCNEDDCGMFRITKPYWIDSGKPTISLDNPEDEGAFRRCATDPVCAANAVRQYMTTFAKDCNKDGTIDCMDFAAIHQYGGYADDCTIPLDKEFSTTFRACVTQVEGLQAARNA